MTLAKAIHSGPPRNQRGQGAIEAILALPVFLILFCIIFQLFFLGLAQVQLQYAAFYAARVGAVHNADPDEMKQAVRKILDRSPGMVSLSQDYLVIEIMDSHQTREERTTSSLQPTAVPLTVRVHWHYPLIVPFADTFSFNSNRFPVLGRPSVHLQASWTMTMFASTVGD